MKDKLNITLLISFLIALILTVWLYLQFENRVGDIAFNKEIDNATFKVCDEKQLFQYYSVNSNYQGGKKALKKEIWEVVQQLSFDTSGLITFRFIINCNGDVGRFRVKSIHNELNEIRFNIQKLHALQSVLENLSNWNPGMWGDEKYDSYYVLNFKIEQGKITDIF